MKIRPYALLPALFLAASAQASDLVYELVNCSQKCGLTPSTSETVDASALNEYDAKASLSDQCYWRRMHLQGEPVCNHTHYDYSKNENAARCESGINSNVYLCRAVVDGRGQGNDNTIARSSGDATADTFAAARSQAMEKCRLGFAGAGVRLYRCDHLWYAPTQ